MEGPELNRPQAKFLGRQLMMRTHRGQHCGYLTMLPAPVWVATHSSGSEDGNIIVDLVGDCFAVNAVSEQFLFPPSSSILRSEFATTVIPRSQVYLRQCTSLSKLTESLINLN